ncbi:hypothetical protein NDU88_003959 [Pleurodeles waltl]|uniref:Uncharacterized protein n=1 Tax=Pleurodeles waltl TaxID=8319 RepID=A0AAV7QDH7_PLEWA|nr:hypothetical protein NDU88_003959 [Pleurodeles waltl]
MRVALRLRRWTGRAVEARGKGARRMRCFLRWWPPGLGMAGSPGGGGGAKDKLCGKRINTGDGRWGCGAAPTSAIGPGLVSSVVCAAARVAGEQLDSAGSASRPAWGCLRGRRLIRAPQGTFVLRPPHHRPHSGWTGMIAPTGERGAAEHERSGHYQAM